MINYEILNPKFFIDSMEGISTIIEEGMLEFNNGIKIFGIGPSRTTLFELNIGADILNVHSDEEVNVPINFFDLQKMLKRLKGGKENIFLFYDNNKITIRGKIGNKTKTFSLAELVELDCEIQVNPIENLLKLDLDSSFKIKTNDFVEALKDCEIYSDYVSLKTKNNSVVISTEAIIGEGSTEIETDPILVESISGYSLLFLKKIFEKITSEEVLIRFTTDFPIMIYDRISESTRMIWFVSPRIDNPEDFE